ncbi:signal transduction histidine kinase [Breznakia blatticola]|uniref:histidine kinase n=1 Tax=Breznakia blatticola TaxID=1754012 RepID=A0A4R8A7E4_9FIRM|nr:HAMP domain-containing sensor histidine kinase [Breznakia blatticola]TDW26409.1 signal transduction histidine kinase [Breznakia blatticola]
MQSSRLRKLVRVFLSIVIMTTTFFFLYAFRFRVIEITDYTNKHNQEDTYERLEKMQSKVENLDIHSYGDQEKISGYINKNFNDYAMQLIGNDWTDNYLFLMSEKWPAENFYFDEAHILEYTLYIGDAEASVIAWPLYPDFFIVYVRVIACVSIIIGVLSYFILSKLYQKQVIRNFTNRISRIKILHKLSIQLIVVNIIAIVLGLSFYSVANQNKYSFFEFVRNKMDFEMPEIDERVLEDAINKAQKVDFDYVKVTEILKDITPANAGIDFLSPDGAHISGYEKFDSYSLYEEHVNVIQVPMSKSTRLFYNGGEITLNMYYYPLIPYVYPYQVIIVLVAILLYMLVLMNFIQYKVTQIRQMQEDIEKLANGDLHHFVCVEGSDELAQLADDMNHMRASFLETIENEEKLQQSNRDLITSISHDLRTPLTSLLGYLEIVKYQKDPKKNAEYIEKSIDKVEQIRNLSDEMFSYFLVYGKQGNVDLQPTPLKDIILYIQEGCILLEHEGFSLQTRFTYDENLIMPMNVLLLKRAIDNMYSNIRKYGAQQTPVIVLVEVHKGMLEVTFKNEIASSNHVESNQIGLKSIEKVVEVHQGEVDIKNDGTSYTIRLGIPIRTA